MSDVSDLMGLGLPGPLAQKVVDILSGGGGNINVDNLAVSQSVKNVLNAADTAGMQTQMGGTSTGKLLFTSDNPEDACDAIQAISRTVAPTNAQRGGVLQQAAIADLTAAPTAANFNALLTALRTAGLLAT
jgi:hypothetical protein